MKIYNRVKDCPKLNTKQTAIIRLNIGSGVGCQPSLSYFHRFAFSILLSYILCTAQLSKHYITISRSALYFYWSLPQLSVSVSVFGIIQFNNYMGNNIKIKLSRTSHTGTRHCLHRKVRCGRILYHQCHISYVSFVLNPLP
jgi:hypothetical protein